VTKDRAASIHARLLNRAKQRAEDFNLVLTRYGIERFLYRLSELPAREVFLLKGALLFDLWFDTPHRATRDADFLGFEPKDGETLVATIREICVVGSDDGMEYDPTSVSVEEIREEARYGGLRARIAAKLGKARISLQLDVGYGDAVTPGPEEAVYPTMLDDMPAPRLRVYPRATVVAEKLEAIASLGMANSRMKDYFDLHAMAKEDVLDERQLGEAIAATFLRRHTPVPDRLPLGLSNEFSNDRTKLAQWRAFGTRNRLDGLELDKVVEEIAAFVEGPLAIASRIDKEAR
jgi:predicted nucleotidyltransferase component of viral defense system